MTVLDAGGRPLQLRFLPDGRLLVGLRSPTGEGSVEVWAVPSGDRVRIPIPDRQSWYLVNQLAVHPSGDRFFLACGTLLTFAADGNAVPDGPAGAADEVVMPPARGRIVTCHRTPAGETLVTGLTGAGERLWQTAYPSTKYHSVAGFLPDGKQYLLLGDRKVVARTFAADGEVASTRYPARHATHPQLAPDGRHLGVIGYGGMYVYDTSPLGPPRQIKGSGNFGNFLAFAFHPAGRTLAVVHGAATLVKLYDLDTLALRTKLNWKVGPLTCLAFSPDGLLGAAGADDGRVVIWDADE